VIRRRSGVRAAAVASAAAIVAAGLVAFATRDSGSVEAFNACIGKSRFLVLTRHGSGNKLIEIIKDRARGGVVGEFAGRAAEGFHVPLAGTGEGDGRYQMFTEVPLGRDARAIQLCFGAVFPQPDT